jgi:predicted choloylglycine hydrolase
MMNLDRREMLNLALLSFLYGACRTASVETGEDFRSASAGRFPSLEVGGSYREIGYRMGRIFKSNITEGLRRRSAWADGLNAVRYTHRGRSYSRDLLKLTRRHFPHLVEEIEGMAAGAGMAFAALWTLFIQCELEAFKEEPEGCSTIFFKNGKQTWLFHNEDGNNAYADLMFTIRVSPPSGVRFAAMVYPGIPAGNGPAMNAAGILQTTNYIGSTHPEVGLPRYVLSRAILEAKTLKEALQIATMTPLAFPCHHNLAEVSSGRYVSVETTPEGHAVFEPEALYHHTNHLVLEPAKEYAREEQVYRAKSSFPRYEVIAQALKTMNTSRARPEDFLRILSSHERAPYSPCRHPKGEVLGMTLGTAFYDIGAGGFRIYKGNPCRAVPGGEFEDFAF